MRPSGFCRDNFKGKPDGMFFGSGKPQKTRTSFLFLCGGKREKKQKRKPIKTEIIELQKSLPGDNPAIAHVSLTEFLIVRK